MSKQSYPKTQARILVLAVASCFTTGAYALPIAPTVVGGTASFNQVGKNILNVTNSNGAIINWQSFNIAGGETTRFIQPSASSAVLNRVLSSNPSLIYGTLSSNGRVWLINPSGILIGAGGQINTAGFVASALPVTDADFLAAKLNFGSPANAANGLVSNQGAITTPQGGSVYLVGASVENSGLIQTPGGQTLLAAGQTVQLIDTATPGVTVQITGDGNSTNLGNILASAGQIGIVGAMVKNSGTLNASSVVNDGGRIFLKASKDVYVDGNGRIVATGATGGQVQVLGNQVAVADNASIDASGTNGGGSVLIGGDAHGANPDIQNSQVTWFGPGATIRASASDDGNGGKVVIWADGTTRAYGSIDATGGANGGNGGFVETSGHGFLDIAGITVSAGAPKGTAGTWLLDPSNITISHSVYGSYSGLTSNYGGTFSGGSSTTSTITDALINSEINGGTSVTISTSGSGSGATGLGDISVQAGVAIHNSSGGYESLTLNADHDIGMTGAKITGSVGNPLAINLNAAHNVTINNSILETDGGYMGVNAGNNIALLGLSAPVGGLTYGSTVLSTAGCAGTAQGCPIDPSSAITTGGYQNISAGGNITLTGATAQYHSGATIISAGGQNVYAGGTITLTAGASGQDNRAVIANVYGGGQTVTAGSILLTAGGSASTDFDDFASITNFDSSYGSQSINITGTAGSIVGYGGSGGAGVSYGATPLANVKSDCAASGVGDYCSTSSNFAGIKNTSYGGQTVNFSHGGGSIAFYGGSLGTENGAGIQNQTPDPNGVTPAGTLSITGSYGGPSIYLQGGTSGGRLVAYGGQIFDLRNSAGIQSDGNLSIYGGDITLVGGGNVNNPNTLGGAIIGAGLSQGNPQVNIISSGNITLTGGTSGVIAPANGGSANYPLSTPAAIGTQYQGDISIETQSLTMTGGSGAAGSPAFIGSINGRAQVNIESTGNVMLTAQQSGVLVGALEAAGGYYGGHVQIYSGGNITVADSATSPVTIGTPGYGYSPVHLAAYGSISLGTTGGAGVLIGSSGGGYADITILAGGYGNPVGGNVTVNPSAKIYGGYIDLFADTQSSLGTTGNIYLAKGSQIVGYGVYMDAGHNITIDGSVRTFSACGECGESGSIAVRAGESQYGGNIQIDGTAVLNADNSVALYANGTTNGGGNITVASGATITAGGYGYGYRGDSIGMVATRNITMNGNVSAGGRYGIYIAAGAYGPYGGDVSIGSTASITSSATGGCCSGNGVIDIRARNGATGTLGDVTTAAGSTISSAYGAQISSYGGDITLGGHLTAAQWVDIHSHAGYGYDGYGGGDVTIANGASVAVTYGGSAPNDSGYSVKIIGARDVTIGGQVNSGYNGVDIGAGAGYYSDERFIFDTGGNLTVNGSITAGYNVRMYAHDDGTGLNGGNITFGAGGAVTGYSVYIQADRNISIGGAVTATAAHFSGGECGECGRSGYAVQINSGRDYGYGGDISLGAHSAIIGHSIGIFTSYGSLANGDITQAAGGKIVTTGYGNSRINAQGNLTLNGSLALAGESSVDLYAGGYGQHLGKNLTIASISAPYGGYVYGGATGSIEVGSIVDGMAADPRGRVGLIAGDGYNAGPGTITGIAGNSVNITAGQVYLEDVYGGFAGAPAINLVTDVSNYLSARVDYPVSQAMYGGISIRDVGTGSGEGRLSVGFRDYAAYGSGISFQHGGDLQIGYAESNGPIFIETAGNLYNTGEGGVYSNATGRNAAVLVAGGSLQNAGSWSVDTPYGSFQEWSSTNPVGDNGGGVNYAFKEYNAAYGITPIIGSLPVGYGGLFYTGQPLVTGTLAGNPTKVYDGTTALTLAPGDVSITAAGGDTDVLTLVSVSGAFATKNVGTAIPVAISSADITAVDANGKPVYGYTNVTISGGSATGSITPATLNLAGLTANDKVYDGNTIATLDVNSLSGAVAGDDVSLVATANFASKNVGANIPVTLTGGITLTGADAGNYIISGVPTGITGNITQLASVAWVGGSSGLWSDPTNWTKGAVPDHANVAAVTIPGNVTVTYDSSVNGGSTTLASANIGSLSMSAGTLTISGALSATGLNQTGGTLNAGSITLNSTTNISQSANSVIITPTLTASSVGSILLNGTGNQISSFEGTAGSDIGLITAVPLTLTAVASGGDVTITSTGGLTTAGAIVATGSVTFVTHSPMTIGSGGITAGDGINLSAGDGSTVTSADELTLNGALSSTGAGGGINLYAGWDLLQNASVSSNGGGISLFADGGGIIMSATAVTNSNGGDISLDAAANIVLGVLNAGSGGVAASSVSGGITSAPGAPQPNVRARRQVFSALGLIDVTSSAGTSSDNSSGGTQTSSGVTQAVTSAVQSAVSNSANSNITSDIIHITAPPSSTTQTTGGTDDSFGSGDSGDTSGNTSTKQSRKVQTCS